MKTKIYTMLCLCFLFAACQTNEPNGKSAQQRALPEGILQQECQSFLTWLQEDHETILDYSFIDMSTMTKPVFGTADRYTDDNTITLNEHISIRLHDSYKVDGNDKTRMFHFTREATVFYDNKPLKSRKRIQQEQYEDPLISVTFTIPGDGLTPPYLIRPKNRCSKIPLCYYDEMEIEWEEDINNHTGIAVVAEWNGLTMNGNCIDTTVVHSAMFDDTGTAVLPNSIFDGMPDEALVNIWLIRGRIVTVSYDDTDLTFEDMRTIIDDDPTAFDVFITNHPELLMSFQTVSFATGAVAMNPIYLIREL